MSLIARSNPPHAVQFAWPVHPLIDIEGRNFCLWSGAMLMPTESTDAPGPPDAQFMSNAYSLNFPCGVLVATRVPQLLETCLLFSPRCSTRSFLRYHVLSST